MERRYRTRLEIIRDILYNIKTIRMPLRNVILRKSNLSYQAFKNHTSLLKRKGFIRLKELPKKKKRYKRNTIIFVITKKGSEFLIEYSKFRDFREKYGI